MVKIWQQGDFGAHFLKFRNVAVNLYIVVVKRAVLGDVNVSEQILFAQLYAIVMVNATGTSFSIPR